MEGPVVKVLIMNDLAEGSLRVAPIEAIEGTPIIDIKPVLGAPDVPTRGHRSQESGINGQTRCLASFSRSCAGSPEPRSALSPGNHACLDAL